MKLLIKIEKSKIFWCLFSLSILFFLLRLPSLIEPNWYGDEGIYQVMGMAIAKSRLLYVQIWDNKPPLLYITYALFNGDQFWVKLFSLKVGIITTLAFYFMAKLLFKQFKPTIIATTLFVLLFATPLLEGNIANAENFMLLPVITAGILIYFYTENSKPLILNSKFLTLTMAGILLGIAFLFKIVALFDFAAFSVYLFIASYQSTNLTKLRKNSSYKMTLSLLYTAIIDFIKLDFAPLLLGFLTPLAITIFYFLSQNAFQNFIQATFFSNVGYVGYGNKFIIPQGLLIIKLALLAAALLAIFLKRKTLTNPIILILVWLSFSLFSTYFSNRPYTHYALLAISCVCLLTGLIYSVNNTNQKKFLLIVLAGTILLLNNTFRPNVKKTLSYYSNAYLFLTGHKNVDSYQSFFDHKTPRDYALANFIKTHTTPAENVFIWGDSAQIYALSGKIPPGKYTVAYHITQYKNGISETQNAINLTKPKYVILLPESKSIPFSLPSYSIKFVLKDATVYERDI